MLQSSTSRLKGVLFASTAFFALSATAQAATDSARPDGAKDEPHGAVVPVEEAQSAKIPLPADAVDAPTITINNNFTPTQARDPNNINGIGQIVTDGGGGSVGLCTATLINRRTVLFAAHCVNTRAATAYGANSGGVGISIGFETNTRANAPGEPDELVNWLLGIGAGPGQFKTNTAQALYNINQVFWNPQSISPTSCTSPTSCFLEADIATGVLDTPTRNIPTWTLLFSPLATPAAINPANGTGYHVTISGYGRNGTGTTGAVGNDFRRRVAENMLGGLTSISTRNLFLFGTTGTPNRTQVLYWLDFDDPTRTNPRDFNGFRDNALTREGLTGPGDSGGPLILDQTFSIPTVIGVLSGGSTFFGGQPGGSYGTQSFYQPLFLYWDWIVANNPYRYVTATAGNKNWEDATAWVTELDPAYRILSGGQLVNGLPTNLGAGPAGNSPQFGELCFQLGGTNECQNIATGAIRNGVPNNPSDQQPIGGALTVNVTTGAEDYLRAADLSGKDTITISSRLDLGNVIDSANSFKLDGAQDAPQADPGFSDTVRPAATLANGLPGATNFVPNNSDPDRLAGISARYYDVTLRNAGTVTLNSAVTIDNFTIAGAQSGLNVASGGSLTSLVEINQLTGTMNVNGMVTALGDYFLMSGLLSGTGRVNAPFLTSVIGNIAPGALGTTGTLTIGGNVVMSSGSSFVIDIAGGGVSDRLAVVANGTSTGLATVGGRLVISPTSGSTIRNGDVYTILTAAGGVNGTFLPASSISAILTPQLLYTANAVQLRILAGSYASVANATPVQRAYAALLDRNRSTSGLSGLYDVLDMQSAAAIQSTLDSWAPRGETLKGAIGTTALDNMSRFYRGRIAGLDLENGLGGTVTTIGTPVQTASRLSVGLNRPGQPLMGYAEDVQRSDALPETMSAFFAGGYLDGKSDPMATAVPFGGDDNFDGYFIAAGIETELASNAALGFGFSYTDIDGTTGGVSQGASGKLYQGTLYGKLQSAGGIVLDTQLSAAMFSARTQRTAFLGTTSYDLRSRDDTLALSAEVGVSKMFDAGALEIGPRAALRASRIAFTPTVERGGPMALAFDRGNYDSLQGLLGFTLSGGVGFRPYASAYFVHEFEDKPGAFAGNFVGSVGLPAAFALAGYDKNWFEASAGVAFGSDKFEVSLGADTTIGRSDVSNQSYRAAVKFRF